MHMHRTSVAVAIAVGCLVLVGCGPDKAVVAGAGPTAGAPAGTTATPPAAPAGGGGGGAQTACDLVTEQDATTAIGAASGPGTPGGGSALSECLFDDGALVVSMKTDAKAFYDQSRASVVAKGEFVDLPDVGDGGFEAGRGPDATLLFIKGTTIVSILLNRDSGDAQAPAIALAKSAATHL